MQIEIINLKKKTEGKAQQHLPIIIKWTCPKCGKKSSDNYSGNSFFLSDMKINGFNKLYFFCGKCNLIKTRQVMIKISLELLEE